MLRGVLCRPHPRVRACQRRNITDQVLPDLPVVGDAGGFPLRWCIFPVVVVDAPSDQPVMNLERGRGFHRERFPVVGAAPYSFDDRSCIGEGDRPDLPDRVVGRAEVSHHHDPDR